MCHDKTKHTLYWLYVQIFKNEDPDLIVFNAEACFLAFMNTYGICGDYTCDHTKYIDEIVENDWAPLNTRTGKRFYRHVWQHQNFKLRDKIIRWMEKNNDPKDIFDDISDFWGMHPLMISETLRDWIEENTPIQPKKNSKRKRERDDDASPLAKKSVCYHFYGDFDDTIDAVTLNFECDIGDHFDYY